MVGQTESMRYPGWTGNLWGARDEPSIEEGILLKEVTHVCISPKLYDRLLNELHDHASRNRKKCNTEQEQHFIGLQIDVEIP